MTFLPLPQPGTTPMRVMTIAGSDSGGGAGIQADMRTFALLGIHGLVAVTAVTVQNSMGVKGFHEIPVDVIAGQIEAVASDIGVQAAKTGMLATAAIVEAASTLPMMSDRRVVTVLRAERILKPKRRGKAAAEEPGDDVDAEPPTELDLLDAYLRNPAPLTTLVITSASFP